MKDKEIIICECHSTEHQFVFLYAEDDSPENDGKKFPLCYVHVHLNKIPFWKRLRYGLRYIFGYQCRYGAFDEFILNPEDAPKIQKLADYLKSMKDEN
jgi:hypothetical protein